MRKHVVMKFSYTEVVNGVDRSNVYEFTFDTKEEAEKFLKKESNRLLNSGLTKESIYYVGEKWFPDPISPVAFEELGPDDLIEEDLPL